MASCVAACIAWSRSHDRPGACLGRYALLGSCAEVGWLSSLRRRALALGHGECPMSAAAAPAADAMAVEAALPLSVASYRRIVVNAPAIIAEADAVLRFAK